MNFSEPQKFVIKSIIDGNTIKVHPRWKWVSDRGTAYGNTVKINGYHVQNKEEESLAVAMLEILLKPVPILEMVPILHSVTLLNPTYIDIDKGIMNCSVYLNDVNISEYFITFRDGRTLVKTSSA